MQLIKSSLDWAKVETELRSLGELMPVFKNDITRFTKHINAMVQDLSKLELKARTRKSTTFAAECEELVKKINAEIKQIEKIHLMSMLSR
jgi:hypothetical protein